MRLLYIPYSCSFYKDESGNYSMPAYGNAFWKKYLLAFDEITILGENASGKENLVKLDDRIKLEMIPANSRPKDILKNDKAVKNILEKHIKESEAILIQATSRKGIMAINIAKRYSKPYFIEITGDIYSTLKTSTSLFRRLYAPFLYMQAKKAIKDAEFGLYVTSRYLQQRYPIKGLQCGCTDTNLSFVDSEVLKKRLETIKQLQKKNKITIGLIGAYSNNRKGIDTAIQAISLINQYQVELHILGFGIEKDRTHWYDFAAQKGVKDKLFFDTPLKSTEEVFDWCDNKDICILPSRSEGLPRCVIEANSRACPAIVSDVCGNTELIEQKWLHKPGDYRKLAALITDMCSNEEEMVNAAKYNFECAKKYTIEKQNEIRKNFFDKFKAYVEQMKKI